MTISNILFRVKQNNYSLSKKDEEMLTCTLAPYTFDSFIFAPRAEIRKAATTTSGLLYFAKWQNKQESCW